MADKMTENIILKGVYIHPGIPDFISVKQYIVTRRGEENQLFFRFENPKDETITAISFSVSCVNAEGNIVQTATVEKKNLKARKGACFVVNTPIVLQANCVDFQVSINYVRFGNYCYVMNGSELEIIYDKQEEVKTVNRVTFLHKLGGKTNKSTLKNLHSTRFFLSLVALIITALFLLIGVKLYNFTYSEEVFSLDQIEYTFASEDRKNGPIIIIGTKSKASNVIIPDKIEGHDVISIASGAFSNSNVRSITLQGNIEIQASAFEGASNLKEVYIESTPHVSPRAFNNCNNLTKVVIEKDLLSIGEGAFEYCTSLKEISIPDTVERIGNNAFTGCRNLTSLVIPDSTTYIGSNVLRNCQSLSFLQVPFIGPTLDEVKTSNYLINNDVGTYSLKTLVVTKSDKIISHMFENKSTVETIRFKTPVTEISSYAFFGCSKLAELDITSTVSEIGAFAFADCASLKSFTIPDKVKVISEGLFQNCHKLETVELPKKLERVNSKAFYNCESLQELPFTENLTYIADNALVNCKGLKKLVLPFLGTNENSSPRSLANIICNGSNSKLEEFTLITGSTLPEAMFADFKQLKRVSLPSELTGISKYAFKNCKNLQTVNIPTSVKYIDSEAFYNCESLQEVDIPASVTTVGESAFYRCLSLLTAHFRGANTQIGNDVFAYCDKLTTLTLPSAMTVIPSGMCMGCSSMEEIVLPEDLNTIDSQAFYECYAMKKLVLPASLNYIGSDAFYNCKRLYIVVNLSNINYVEDNFPAEIRVFSSWEEKEEYTVEKDGFTLLCDVENNWYLIDYVGGQETQQLPKIRVNGIPIKYELPNYLFYRDKTVKRVKISADVTKLGSYVFEECSNLTTVTADSTSSFEEIGAYAFVNSGVKAVTIPSSTKKIGEYAFYKTDIETITIPTSVTSISSGAFYYCSKLKTLIFEWGSKLTSIGEVAFSQTAIESVVIPASVTTIGTDAFHSCAKLKSLTFGAGSSLKSIGSSAFYQTAIESVVIPASVTSIGHNAFNSCRKLKSLTFASGSHLNMIDYGAFYQTAIESVVIPASVTTIGSDAFNSCSKLKSLTFGAGSSLKTIGSGAFSQTAIESVAIPASVTTIGSDAFNSCSKLKSLTFKSDSYLKSIGSYAFYDTEMETLSLPASLTEVGDSAFASCDKLKSVTIRSKFNAYNNAFSGSNNILEVYNLSGASLTAGSSDFGGVAINAIIVHTRADAEPLHDVVVDEYSFKKSDNNWFLMGLANNSTTKNLVFKNFNYNGITVNSYVIYKSAFMNNTNINSVVIGKAVREIGNGAFYGCYNLYDVANVSNLTITKGSESNGYVGFYAAIVRKDDAPLTQTNITSDYVSAQFAKYNNTWYLVDAYLTTNTATVVIPELNVEGKAQPYIIADYALRDLIASYNQPSILFKGNVSKIEDHAITYLKNCTIYFNGTKSQWASLDKKNACNNVYTYVDCVHEFGTWTYDSNQNIVSYPAQWEVTKYVAPNCKEPGSQTLTCPNCKEERVESLPINNEHKWDADGNKCTVCGKEKIITLVNAENFNSLKYIKNDTNNPFAIDSNGVITTKNKLRNSTSTLTINATEEMIVRFEYRVYSGSLVDYFTIYLNGSQTDRVYGNTNYATHEIKLKAGDVLKFEYTKYSTESGISYCGYIRNLVIETYK